MRHFYRFIILLTALFSGNGFAAIGFFADAIDWRPTETNDWVYINSETLPTQSLIYKTIDFRHTPGYRLGMIYDSVFDALLSYTHLRAMASDSAIGNMQPSFLGSVTAKPFPPGAYLYRSGQVRQILDYNIFDLNVGRQFYPTTWVVLHPIVGLMGGWIHQSIYASYQGSTSTSESIKNNFVGIGPKIGLDTTVRLFSYCYTPSLLVSFAASYQLGNWDIRDLTKVTPEATVKIIGANHSMGALTLQSLVGFGLDYKKFSIKLAYEISDWFDQMQIFDNDTGAHNNDLILQGFTLSIAYHF